MKKILPVFLILFSFTGGLAVAQEETAVSEEESIPEDIIESTDGGTVVEEPEEFFEAEDFSSPSTGSGTTESSGSEESSVSAESQKIEKNLLTLPLDERDEIERFRKQYLDPKWTQVLYNALENAIDYRLYIRKELKEQELPPELEYLPVVESNYKTNAKSKSGALGLWQFMENSVKPMLTLNDYVDERLDPWKETAAALRKLKENYDYFGDWLIAIGAYNCGAGAMSRAIAKLGETDKKDFWTLCDKNLIPSQTKLYVPKLLAIADLANNCEYFGIDIPSHEEEYEVLYNEKNAVFDYVTVNKAYSLTVLAQQMRIDEAELKRLNPSFFLGFTHPSAVSSIRLPSGTEQIALEVLQTMEPIDFPLKYTVVKGDSLWSISRRYGCTVSQICELNGIKENAILKIGKILYIPSK